MVYMKGTKNIRIDSLFLFLGVLLFLFFSAEQISALEVTAHYHMGNLGFDPDAEKTTDTLKGSDYTYGVSAYGEHRIDDSLSLEAGLYHDPILRNTVHTRFKYTHPYFRVGVGPFIGVFNSPDSIMNSGISTSVHVEYPGKFFASIRSDSTISSGFVAKGDYAQEFSKLRAGYYIPNAICGINMITKRYIAQKTKKLKIDTDFSEYSFDVDIYQKNVPVRLLVTFAYQSTERVYTEDSVETSNTLNSVVLGTKFSFELNPHLTLLADIDHNVYSFGKNIDASNENTALSMPESGLGSYLFKASIGATWNFQ